MIRANNNQAITNILSSYNIPLQANKNTVGAPLLLSSKKNEDGSGIGNKMGEKKRKKQVHTVCNSLFLNNNEIRTIKGIRDIMNYVVWQPDNLEWIDLSYNYL